MAIDTMHPFRYPGNGYVMNKYIAIIGVVLMFAVGGVFIAVRNNQPAVIPPPSAPQTADRQRQTTEPVVDVDEYRYVTHSPATFAAATGKKRVYFFHASWCPTCKASNGEFEKDAAAIPQDVVVFKTDYDANADLKKKYGVTYQHTFVQVDEQGNEIAKWNGGGIQELVANVK